MEQEGVGFQLVVRAYELKDYPVVAKLWEGHDSESPPIDVLGKSGVVVECEGEMICAIFIYQPASAMGMLEFMVAKIGVGREKRKEAIDLMLSKSVEICKKIGYKYIYTATSSEKFIKRLEESGFKAKGNKQQHMFWGM